MYKLKTLSKFVSLFKVPRAGISTDLLFKPLKELDPEMDRILHGETQRQKESINLIASENFASKAVREALGSTMCNKYSEGYVGQRYYGGNEFIDQSEALCIKRALEAFRVTPEQWDVNVQPLSGSPANFYIYSALLQPHERIMALDLPHGGHLSHGYQTDTKKVSSVSIFYNTMPYRVNEETGLIDYDKLEEHATYFRPKLIVAGMSAYPRFYDYKRMRDICDKVGAYLLADMAHISGLVAAGVVPSPFEYSDIVSTTTHKSLRGPRGAMIFYRVGQKGVDKKGKEIMWDLKSKIDFSVFPGHQGGPHNHTIAALAVALKQAQSEFQEYQTQVLKNSKRMADSLLKKDFILCTGGTDVHLVLVDLKNKGIDGERLTYLFDNINISANKNTVPGDKSAIVPRGVRLGSPAMTSRGLVEKDFDQIVEYIDRGVKIAKRLKGECEGTKLIDYKAFVNKVRDSDAEIVKLREEVKKFSTSFPCPE